MERSSGCPYLISSETEDCAVGFKPSPGDELELTLMSRGMEKPPPGEFLIKPYWGGYEKDRLVCAMIDSDLQPYIVGLPRMTGVTNGYPVLDDGRALEVSNVIWCTGFTPNYDWIELPLPAHNGVPIHDRGIVESCPGLYFVGLPFLYSLSSALLD